MSLEKEPAGAFNKAQRLIEQAQCTPRSFFYKGGSRFVFGQSSCLKCRDAGRPYRLTCPHESGHVTD